MKIDNSEKSNGRLQSLNKLVGVWNIEGELVHGQVSFEWMKGEFFLKQNVCVQFNNQMIIGLEIIGQGKKDEEIRGIEEIRSQFFDNSGNILEYVYEMNENELIIWAGEKHSSSYYKGKLSNDNNSITGFWCWPGGGYESTMIRVTNFECVL